MLYVCRQCHSHKLRPSCAKKYSNTHTHTKIYLGLFSITVIGIEKEITLSITSSSLLAIRSENSHFDIINESLVKQSLEWRVCLFAYVRYEMIVCRNIDSRLILC